MKIVNSADWYVDIIVCDKVVRVTICLVEMDVGAEFVRGNGEGGKL